MERANRIRYLGARSYHRSPGPVRCIRRGRARISYRGWCPGFWLVLRRLHASLAAVLSGVNHEKQRLVGHDRSAVRRSTVSYCSATTQRLVTSYRIFSSAHTVSEIIHSVSQSACSILSALKVSRPSSTVISNARLRSDSGWGLGGDTHHSHRVGPINESIRVERAVTRRLAAVWRLVTSGSTRSSRLCRGASRTGTRRR